MADVVKPHLTTVGLVVKSEEKQEPKKDVPEVVAEAEKPVKLARGRKKA